MYMSPEVADCKPYGAASDTYGLGCVLLEMLLRHQLRERRPFEERKDYISEALRAARGHGWYSFERMEEVPPADGVAPLVPPAVLLCRHSRAYRHSPLRATARLLLWLSSYGACSMRSPRRASSCPPLPPPQPVSRTRRARTLCACPFLVATGALSSPLPALTFHSFCIPRRRRGHAHPFARC